jgi:hypothetical protein
MDLPTLLVCSSSEENGPQGNTKVLVQLQPFPTKRAAASTNAPTVVVQHGHTQDKTLPQTQRAHAKQIFLLEYSLRHEAKTIFASEYPWHHFRHYSMDFWRLLLDELDR